MFRTSLGVGLLFATTLTMATAQDPKLETQNDKASYIIGQNIGRTIKGDGIELNIDNLIIGLREALAGKECKIPEAEQAQIMQKFQQDLEAKAAQANTKYLEDNKKKEGVTVTKSGLQYEVMKAGTGKKPTAADTVSVHYHGTLVNGTVFDSSVERGQPTSFGVGEVIPGWTEALQLMPVGSKWKIVIPSNLAYGPRGAGSIPPNSTLVFEVELLEIEGAAKE